MIIPKVSKLTPEQEAELIRVTGEFGVSLQTIRGESQTIYAMKGDETSELLVARIEGLEYIDRVDRIQTPYKLMARNNELSKHKIRVGSKIIGQDFVVMAGHCTIDPKNPTAFFETAMAVKEAGADVVRGGIWKPRTNPHSYQGDAQALDVLMDARAKTGLPVITEVMDEQQLVLAVERGVDMLQIGARNALNYSLLREVGRQVFGKPITVLLKRGMHMGRIEEFLLAAEYIVSGGNPNILLTPRGTLPAMDGYRNHPDECITPLLKEKTWAPVVVDPSHSVGKAAYVPFSALAAVAYGADGLIVETHVNPKTGIGDDPKQAITPEVLAKLIQDSRAVHAMMRGPVQLVAKG
ncbi:MAG: 3-deoxy-D-arabino-heptulosonate 7-phosphate synthase [Deltaproteobacteria bacterium]|nr:3-deoxy-D-arabino-heptulosonate 7-phosphate synthase [Deltaproteobacteria bacterium]